jgi:hypothetical protein
VGVRSKRVGWRLMNRFVDSDDLSIDNVSVFAAERGVRDLIGERYWIPMLRIFHELYHGVMQGGDTPRFDTTASDYALNFPPSTVKRGMDFYADLFEVYDPPRGSPGDYNMEELYQELRASHRLDMHDRDFYASSFKALLLQKIKTFRAQHGMPDSMQGGPRYKGPRSGSPRFYGVRLLSDAGDAGEGPAAGS